MFKTFVRRAALIAIWPLAYGVLLYECFFIQRTLPKRMWYDIQFRDMKRFFVEAWNSGKAYL